MGKKTCIKQHYNLTLVPGQQAGCNLTGMSDETSPVSDGEPGTSLGLRISLSSGGKARSLPHGARLRRGTAAAAAPRRWPCAGAAAAAGRSWEVERIVSAAASMDKKRGYFFRLCCRDCRAEQAH